VSFEVGEDDDRLVVERCLGGDTAAFRTLVERYQRVLFTVAVRMLGETGPAADAAQDAFVRAYRKLQTYDSRHKFFSWLYRILVNECLNVRRSRRLLEPLGAGMASADNPHRAAEQAELRVSVQTALRRLSPAYREAIVLRHYSGLSYAEIAESVGVPEKTVKSRLYSARQQLGEDLLDWKREP
jgi:RNA polymerase sigma-70 factor (ECF subfamily)